MKVKKQNKLEMCQYDTDAPALGHPHPHAGILQKMKLKPEFRRRRRCTCWGKSHRTWLLNKFISFLAVLSWKSDKN